MGILSVLVTAHFSVEEMACHDGTRYPLDVIETRGPDAGRTWLDSRLRPLCETLEAIRAAAGGSAIRVTSGYRSLAYNRRLGSHDTSQHPAGRAADIIHPTLRPHDLHALIVQLYHRGDLPRLGGLGLYPTFIHVDVRHRPEDGHLAQWTGGRATNEAG